MDKAQVNELFEIMQNKFQAEKAVGVDAVIQFNLSSDEFDTYYWITITNGTVGLFEGQTDSAKTTFTAKATDYADVVHGKLNAMQAFMQGKLKVKGDMGLAMKLQSIFNL